MKLVFSTFAAMAGLCFMSGLLVLSNEGDNNYGTTRDTSGNVG